MPALLRTLLLPAGEDLGLPVELLVLLRADDADLVVAAAETTAGVDDGVDVQA